MVLGTRINEAPGPKLIGVEQITHHGALIVRLSIGGDDNPWPLVVGGIRVGHTTPTNTRREYAPKKENEASFKKPWCTGHVSISMG